jgi:hypothetical protein
MAEHLDRDGTVFGVHPPTYNHISIARGLNLNQI